MIGAQHKISVFGLVVFLKIIGNVEMSNIKQLELMYVQYSQLQLIRHPG